MSSVEPINDINPTPMTGLYPERQSSTFEHALHYTHRDLYRLSYKIMKRLHDKPSHSWLTDLSLGDIKKYPKTELTPFERLLRRWIIMYPSKFHRFKTHFVPSEAEKKQLGPVQLNRRVSTGGNLETSSQRFRIRTSDSSVALDPDFTTSSSSVRSSNKATPSQTSKPSNTPQKITPASRPRNRVNGASLKRYQIQRSQQRVDYQRTLLMLALLKSQQPHTQAIRLYMSAIYSIGAMPAYPVYRKRFKYPNPLKAPSVKKVQALQPVEPVNPIHTLDEFI